MKSFIIFIITVLFFSCSKKEKQNGVLPASDMKLVLADMIRADMFIMDFVAKDSTKNKKNESIKLYEEIFRIHKISKEQFKKSIDYYENHPADFQPILDSLAQRPKAIDPKIIYNGDTILIKKPKLERVH